MKKHSIWAIKYIDENGFTLSVGYADALDHHETGEITTDIFGNCILWEFEI